MDEALDLGLFGGGEYRAGAGDIACFKPARVRGIDHAGDVNQGIRAFCQQVETGLVGSVPATELAYCAPPNCYSSLAFLVEPYFVIITIPRGAGDFGDAGVLGQRVIDRLIRG